MVERNNATTILVNSSLRSLELVGLGSSPWNIRERIAELAAADAKRRMECLYLRRKIFVGGRGQENHNEIAFDGGGVWCLSLRCLFSPKRFEKNPTRDLHGYEETRRVGQVGTEGMALHDVEILELCWLAEAFCINI
jgi:hypothetical protein